jgi:hypothetical protein
MDERFQFAGAGASSGYTIIGGYQARFSALANTVSNSFMYATAQTLYEQAASLSHASCASLFSQTVVTPFSMQPVVCEEIKRRTADCGAGCSTGHVAVEAQT